MYKINVNEIEKVTLLSALYASEEILKDKIFTATAELVKDSENDGQDYWIEKIKELGEDLNNIDRIIKEIKEAPLLEIPDFEKAFDE